jgi:hypothetical protein
VVFYGYLTLGILGPGPIFQYCLTETSELDFNLIASMPSLIFNNIIHINVVGGLKQRSDLEVGPNLPNLPKVKYSRNTTVILVASGSLTLMSVLHTCCLAFWLWDTPYPGVRHTAMWLGAMLAQVVDRWCRSGSVVTGFHANAFRTPTANCGESSMAKNHIRALRPKTLVNSDCVNLGVPFNICASKPFLNPSGPWLEVP